VKCDQIITVPAVLLGPRLGRLNPAAIDRVDDALRFVLGL
jgi:mRNA-degrading endonuclease toxin of MazEF toxin-antitoxin module